MTEKYPRKGFVVEEVTEGCKTEGCPAKKFLVNSSEYYGEDVFNDLTEGMTVGQHTCDSDNEGECPKCKKPVDFIRHFVVTEDANAAKKRKIEMAQEEDYCGYFKFKVDTKNPQKDKRKNNIAYMPEWFAGVYVIVIKRNQDDFRIIFTDSSTVDLSSKQMISLHENLEKLPVRLDLMLIKAYFANWDRPENFIEYLLHMGKINLSDLEEVEKILSENQNNETSPNLDESFNATAAIISDRQKYMTIRLQR